MSDQPPPGGEALSTSLLQRVDESCDRFEEAWKTGQRPRIEDYLEAVPEPERSKLLGELLKVELEYRHRNHETFTAEQYRQRFPGHADLIAASFALTEDLSEPPSGTAGSSQGASGRDPGIHLQPTDPGRPREGSKDDSTGAHHAADLPSIPGYEILGELGRGGMGVVYQAWQTGLHRLVALKMVLAGAHASAEELARFWTEAEAVARLQHPHIVQIYEIGQHDLHPYMALEYADSGSLAQQLQGSPLPAGQAAQWLALLARTAHYAHQHGIVHRDLKPANVLLTHSEPPDGLPLGGVNALGQAAHYVPKITDFGLAKLLVGGGRTLTQSGAFLGTPGYTAPEQATGKSKEISPATDVYALGAILYELLTGRPPFKAETPQEALVQVQSQEPVSPSRLRPKLPRDLTTICLKCLEKQPGRRYASAEALADDLERFLAGQPIQARPIRNPERLWRWCRRNPVVATLAAAIVLLLVVLTGSTLIQNSHLAAALHASEEANREANERLWESLRDRAQALRRSQHTGQRVKSLRSIAEAMQLPLPSGHSLDELRTEAIAALALPDLESLQEWEGFPANAISLDFDGNLERYARLATDGTVSVRRVSDDAEVAHWQELTEGAWPASESNLRFSLDGRLLCSRHATSGRLVVHRLEGSAPVICYSGSKAQRGYAMDFSPDSNRLAYLLTDSRIGIVDLTTGDVRYLPPTGAAQDCIQFAPDGRRFALTVHRADKWAIEVRDAGTGQVQESFPHPTAASHAAWHPDGRTLATCSDDDLLIRLWDVPSGHLLRKLEGHKTQGIHCAFTGTGDRLLSNDWNGVLRIWEPSSGRQLLSFPAGSYRVSADDRVSARDVANTTRLQVLRLYPGQEYSTINLGGSISSRRVDLSTNPLVHPDGRLLAVLLRDFSLALVDLKAGREVGNLRIPSAWPLLWQPSGDLLTAGRQGFLRWPVRADPAGAKQYRFGPPEPLVPGHYVGTPCAISTDGQTIAIPNFKRGAVVLHRNQPACTLLLQPQEDVRSCAVSPDGRWVATGSHGNTDGVAAKVWEAATGRPVKGFSVSRFCSVAFSPDGRWLLTTGGGCRLWEVGSWNEGPKVGGASGCFSPDGHLLAVEDSAGAIRLVHPADGTELARLEAPEQTRLVPCCFTPDGARLIAVGIDTQALHIWDLQAVRQGLAALGLDLKLPPFSPANEGPAAPLQVQVDVGTTFEFLQGRYRTSIGLNSFLLALNPFNFEAYLRRGKAYGRLGESKRAMDDYTLFLLLAPPQDQRRGEALFRRSNNYANLKDSSKAEADLQTLAVLDLYLPVELQPKAAKQCNNLAWRYVTGPEKQRDSHKALFLVQKAVKLAPDQRSYWNTLGVAYYRLGQYSQAIEKLEHSLRESKGKSAAIDRFFLAMCHARQGNAAKAKDCYDRAVHWVQEQQGKLRAEQKKELDAFRAEAEAVLQRATKL
jgi:serine/threonine protein kinase/WD40 repeat protein/tetratricopeptide (TPR) repeat protein